MLKNNHLYFLLLFGISHNFNCYPMNELKQPLRLTELCIKSFSKNKNSESMEKLENVVLPSELSLELFKIHISCQDIYSLSKTIQQFPAHDLLELQLYIATNNLKNNKDETLKLYEKATIVHAMLMHEYLNEKDKTVLKFFDQEYKKIVEGSSAKRSFWGPNIEYTDIVSSEQLMKNACEYLDSTEPVSFLLSKKISLPNNIIESLIERNKDFKKRLSRLKFLLKKGAIINKGIPLPVCFCPAYDHFNCGNAKFIPSGPLHYTHKIIRELDEPPSNFQNFITKVIKLLERYDNSGDKRGN